VPGHEDLVGIRSFSEHFRPGSGRVGSRKQHGLLLLKALDEPGWHRLPPRCLGERRMVARVGPDPYFVFHLHHDHRVLLSVDLTEVPHQRCESFRVGVAGLDAD
jgi:hypothetical protein